MLDLTAARDLYHEQAIQAHGVLNVHIPVLMVLTPAGVGMHANIASSDPYNTLDTLTVQHVGRRVFKPQYVGWQGSAIAEQRSAEGTTDINGWYPLRALRPLPPVGEDFVWKRGQFDESDHGIVLRQ
jgi:hypothetical protein